MQLFFYRFVSIAILALKLYNIFMKKIIILDGACVKQKDLSVDFFAKAGDVKYYDRTSNEETILRINSHKAEIVITNKVPIDKNIMDSCPTIKFITVLATGYNIIDCEYARKKGIKVANAPDYSSDSVAQHTMALILEFASSVSEHNLAVKNGEWEKNMDFCFCKKNIFELTGKTLGIIGYGSIGKKVTIIARAFGMNVIYCKNTPDTFSKSLEYVLSESDIISLHCPLNASTEKIINKTAIEKMKRGIYIINTARGGLVDENAIAEGLDNGIIAGYAADVLYSEPPKTGNILINNPKSIITPHVAWATFEARKRLLDITYNNIQAYIADKPINIVN